MIENDLLHRNSTGTSETQQEIKHNFLYTNTDVLHNKIEELEMYLDKHKDILFIAITETLPKTANSEETKDTNFILPGYNCVTNNNGRGVCLFIKKGIEYEVISEYQTLFNPNIFCKIEEPDNDPYIVAVVYRSPNGTEEEADKLNELMNHVALKHKNNKMVIVGDFNFPEVDWNNEESSKNDQHKSTRFLTCVQSNYMTQLVTAPTHYRGSQNPTLVDLILTNEEEFVNDIKTYPPLGKSHHLLLSFRIEAYHKQVEDSGKIKYQVNKGNYDEMREHVGNVDWNELSECDVDDMFDGIEQILTEAKNMYIPKKKIRNNYFVKRSFSAPDTLLYSLQLKRKAFKIYKKFPTTENRNNYIKYRNEVKAGVKKAKKQKEINIAKEAKTNPKALFDYVASKTKQREGIANLVKDDGSLTKNEGEKAQVLSQFFKSVYTCEGDGPVPDFESKFSKPIAHIEVSEADMEKALKNIKVNKSPGPDGLHPRILRELSHELAKPFKMLFDKCMAQGKLPKK